MPSRYFFHSNAKGDACTLSNFYAPEEPFDVRYPDSPLIPEHMRGVTLTFRTSEHAFQALKTTDLPSAERFAAGGLFSDFAVYRTWPAGKAKTVDIEDKQRSHWGKKDMLGIIPQMAARVDPAVARRIWGINLNPSPWNAPLTPEEIAVIWEPILDGKYGIHRDRDVDAEEAPAAPRPPLTRQARALLATGDSELVEFSGRAKPSTFWAAKALDNKDPDNSPLVGQNVMGGLVEAARERLRRSVL